VKTLKIPPLEGDKGGGSSEYLIFLMFLFFIFFANYNFHTTSPAWEGDKNRPTLSFLKLQLGKVK